MKRTRTNQTAGEARMGQPGSVRGLVPGLALGLVLGLGLGLAAGCSDQETDSGNSKIIGKDGVPCPEVAAPGPDFCPNGRVEQVNNANGCPYFACVAAECPLVALPEQSSFCPDGTIEKVLDGGGCPTLVCASTNCPIYNQPECPAGQKIELQVDENGCDYPECVPIDCPDYNIPLCADGEHVEVVVNELGCNEPRCVPIRCPVYNIPLCRTGEHVETIVNEDGCKEPVCVPDVDPCPTIAAPDATFCPNGQVLLDTQPCNWVCHGGDRCPFLGPLDECPGTTVIESDPETHCLTDLRCLP